MAITSSVPAAPPSTPAVAAAERAAVLPAACCHAASHPASAVAAAGSLRAATPVRAPAYAAAAAAARNTAVCLLGCSLGDVAVVVISRLVLPGAAPLAVLLLAIIAGLVTSVGLETVYLRAQGQPLQRALRLAAGMSLVSMISMELAMNAVDLGLSGGMRMQLPWASYLGILLVGEMAGFGAAFPYNWWRLARRGRSCH